MKKVFSSLMVVTMLCNSAFAAQGAANADHSKMIGKTFDHFRYSMTVDVRANDPASQEIAVSQLKDQLDRLQSEGVSPAELMDYLRASILDASTRADFDRLIASMDVDALTAEQAGTIAMKFMSGKYQQGANYSGAGVGSNNTAMIAVGVILAGVVTCIVIKHIKQQRCNHNNNQGGWTPGMDHPSFQ